MNINASQTPIFDIALHKLTYTTIRENTLFEKLSSLIMKKRIVFLFLYLFSGFLIQAQSTFKTGINFARFKPDKQNGIGYFTEYNYHISSMLTLASSLQMVYGTKGQDYPYYLLNKFSTGLDINLFYHPIHLDKGVIRFGLGPSMRYFSGRNRSDFTVADRASIGGLGPDGSYEVPLFYPNDRLKPNYFAIGYSGLLEGEINPSTRWRSAIRAVYQGYSSKDYITTIGFNVGYHF